LLPSTTPIALVFHLHVGAVPADDPPSHFELVLAPRGDGTNMDGVMGGKLFMGLLVEKHEKTVGDLC
jgi:hypothetical protein